MRSPPESVPAGAVADRGERRARELAAGRVPVSLELVAAEVRPGADRLAEPHAGALVARGEVALGGEQREPGVAHARRRDAQQQLAHLPRPVPTSWAM